MNLFRQSQAVFIFVNWLVLLEAALRDKKLEDKEISELILSLLPILQLYGLNVSVPAFKTGIATEIFNKIQTAAIIAKAVNSSTGMAQGMPDRSGQNYQ